MSRSKSQSDRLSCRIDRDLLEWVRWYAAQRRTTVTRLVREFFQSLRSRHDNDAMNEVDQL